MFSILFLRLVCSSFGSCFTCLKHWLMVKTSEKTDHFNSGIPGSDSDSVLCWGVPHISFFAYVSVRHHKLLRLVSPLVTMNLLLRGSQVSYSGISSVYHLTTARLSLFGLRFVRSSNHLPILIRHSRRQPRQQKSLTPSQKQFQKVTSGVLSTGVRGAPRLTQCLDPIVSYFLITGLLRFSIVVSLQNDPTRFSVFETSKQATHTLPLQLKPPSPEKRHAPSTHRSSEESLFLGRGFSPTFDVVLVRRRLSSLKQELGIFQLLLGLTIPFRHSAPKLKLKLIVSQPISMWGGLIFLINPLKIIGGFTGVFTETILHIVQYFSYWKSMIFLHLLVGSPGSTHSSSPPFFYPEEHPIPSHAAFRRSDFPLDFIWRSLSIFIADLLSCVAVRLGPEDATNCVSTTFRDAVWILMSQFKVTISISQAFSAAMNLVSTHSNFVLNSLLSYLRGFFISIVSVLLYYVRRVWLNSFLICSSHI